MKVVCVCVLLSLVVGGLAVVTLSPDEITVSEFQNAIFNCTPLSGSTEYSVEKAEPGSTLFSAITTDVRLQRVKEPSNNREVFTYLNVTREDSGTKFRCDLGGDISNEALLDVQYAPEYEEPDDQVASEDSSLTVRLNITANPMPSASTWLKNWVAVVPDDRVMVGVNYITFTALSRDDTGTYSFNTSNSEGPGPQVSFELDVQYGPEFVGVNPLCDQSTSDPIECAVLLGTLSASLDCSVTGNPVPAVTGTTTATESIALTDDMFSFTSAVVEDNAGNYTCTATGLTTEVRTFRLSVGGVPTITNLTVETVGTDASISWEYDDGGVPVLDFSINVTEGGTSIYSMVIGSDMFEPDTTVQFDVPSNTLKASTEYVVTVSGRNLLGQSEEVSFTFTTEAEDNAGSAVFSFSVLTLLLMVISALVL